MSNNIIFASKFMILRSGGSQLQKGNCCTPITFLFLLLFLLEYPTPTLPSTFLLFPIASLFEKLLGFFLPFLPNVNRPFKNNNNLEKNREKGNKKIRIYLKSINHFIFYFKVILLILIFLCKD